MASIGREGERGELKRIIYRDAAGKQQSLRLGKCSERAATNALAGFERVYEAHRVGSTIHPDGVRWLEAIDDRLHARVVRLGLGVEPRKGAAVVTLANLLDRFDAAASVKAGTRTTYLQALGMLRDYFGESMPIGSITPAHADNWRKAIAEPMTVKGDDGKETTKQLAPATVAKRVRVAKAVFRKAMKWGLIASNPFADLRAGSQSNPDRAFYVTVESIRAILEACPDDQWRAVVALSRFAGLRCPSEVAALRWGDVNWERGRLMVRSPKTAGREGHAVRVVPIAPELRPILQDLFDRAEVGVEAVVPRRRDPAMNLRTQFERIIAKAGVKPWPRLFHNMRASCATDLAERGIKPGLQRLFIIDGSKALRAGIDAVYGSDQPVQRCRIHKIRNVQGHLPDPKARSATMVLRAAFKMEDHTKAMGKIRDLARELQSEWPSASSSLLEGLEEMFTVNRLGLPPSLRRRLATTNIIESPQSTVRRLTHKVDRWRDGSMALRWAAASFLEAERTMRKIGGCRQVWMLAAALERSDQDRLATVRQAG